jgi:hypothetical protein
VEAFKTKLFLGIDDFEETRIMIMMLFIQDGSGSFYAIMTSDLSDLKLFYINFIVMIIYNLT